MYFSNSTHGLMFEAKNCEGCAHITPGGECPLQTAMFAYNGADNGALNVLQNMSKGDTIGTCHMRIERVGAGDSVPDVSADKMPWAPTHGGRWTVEEHTRAFLHEARRAFEQGHMARARANIAQAFEHIRELAPRQADGGGAFERRAPAPVASPAAKKLQRQAIKLEGLASELRRETDSRRHVNRIAPNTEPSDLLVKLGTKAVYALEGAARSLRKLAKENNNA